jgi:hypothetical protein
LLDLVIPYANGCSNRSRDATSPNGLQFGTEALPPERSSGGVSLRLVLRI